MRNCQVQNAEGVVQVSGKGSSWSLLFCFNRFLAAGRYFVSIVSTLYRVVTEPLQSINLHHVVV